MKARLTRRKLAAAVLGSAAAARAAQTAAEAQAAPARTADEELQAARERMRSNLETLARQTVPMATEPAFQFKA